MSNISGWKANLSPTVSCYFFFYFFLQYRMQWAQWRRAAPRRPVYVYVHKSTWFALAHCKWMWSSAPAMLPAPTLSSPRPASKIMNRIIVIQLHNHAAFVSASLSRATWYWPLFHSTVFPGNVMWPITQFEAEVTIAAIQLQFFQKIK